MSVMSRKIPVTFDRRDRHGIYGENGKNASILIRTILGFSLIMH